MNEIKENCIFCKIVAGIIPADIVYENDDYMAFLDIRPCAPGHVQVIPKEHMRWVWDSEDIGGYFTVVQKIAHALQKAYGVDLVRSKVFGEEVPHAHVWVWPDVPCDGTEKDFEKHKNLIRKFLA